MSTTRVNVSMVSLKWGDALSIFLPGTVAILAAYPYFPLLQTLINGMATGSIAVGAALLIAATLAGGVLEAVTRITWERYWLVKWCPSPDILSTLTKDNIELYERGVQSSYKWVTFYANLAWATLLLLVSRVHNGAPFYSTSNVVLIAVVAVLLRASHVQWTYFVKYITKVFGGTHAEKRSAVGDQSEVSGERPEGQDE